ncbi:Zn-ribbon domain-containing OB-fold protein [Rhizobium lusitanum]|nr:OB-fold domain-containing protein [Rhizobium lusitanum]
MADNAVENRSEEDAELLSPAVMSFDDDGRPHLRGGRCQTCGARTFPRVEVCPACMGEEMVEEIMPDHGTLYSYTVVHVGPACWEKPMTLGYVDFDNGVRVFTHLKGKVAIGQEVALSLDTVGHQPDGRELHSFVFSADGVS